MWESTAKKTETNDKQVYFKMEKTSCNITFRLKKTGIF